VPSAEHDNSCILELCIERPQTAFVWASKVSCSTLGSWGIKWNKINLNLAPQSKSKEYTNLLSKPIQQLMLTKWIIRIYVRVWYVPASNGSVCTATVATLSCGTHSQTEYRATVSTESVHWFYINWCRCPEQVQIEHNHVNNMRVCVCVRACTTAFIKLFFNLLLCWYSFLQIPQFQCVIFRCCE